MQNDHEQWHLDLERALTPLDGCALECDGMTNVISYLLRQHGIDHRVESGELQDTRSSKIVKPHLWVRLLSGRIIDFRARIWLGTAVGVPHGVFPAEAYEAVIYSGMPIQPAPLSAGLVWLLSDGLSDQVSDLSRLQYQQGQM